MNINPKEKLRLNARRKALAQYPLNTAEHAEIRRRITMQYTQEDAARMRRCRSAISKGLVFIPFDGRMIQYDPVKGTMVWAIHFKKYMIGEDALKVRKNGIRYVPMSDGTAIMATRLAHEAVHGQLPDGHEVYCINNDPSDLRILNLQHREVGRFSPKAMTNNERSHVLEDLARIKRERGLL